MGKVVLSLCLALSLTACDLTGPDVVDPYAAVGSTLLAAVLALMATRKRRAAIKAKRKAQGLD